MTQPISFTSQTPRFGLPILFSGQAQKEFYLNEAHALIDSLLHPIVKGTSSNVPESPEPGDCWIVGSQAEGDWLGHAGEIACFQSGMWLFAKAADGMRVFDRSVGTMVFYRGDWNAAEAVELPNEGVTVDTEARTAITKLVQTLVTAGILPAN